MIKLKILNPYCGSFFKVVVLILYGSFNLVAQSVEYVNQMQFTKTQNHYVLVGRGVSPMDMHPYDIPLLEPKSNVVDVKYSLDSEGNTQAENTLVSAINIQEEWEGLADKWVVNQNGISTYNKDKRRGYSFESNMPHSNMSGAFYRANQLRIKESGFLITKAFPKTLLRESEISYPKREVANAVLYKIKPNVLKAVGRSFPYKIVNVTYGDDVDINLDQVDPDDDYEIGGVMPDSPISITTLTYGEFHCGEALLSHEVHETFDKLQNNECVKKIMETTYSNYILECNARERSNENPIAREANILIYPNPLNQSFINVLIPEESEYSIIEIDLLSIDGKHLASFNIGSDARHIQIPVAEFIYSEGMYMLALKGKNEMQIKKFFYTKN